MIIIGKKITMIGKRFNNLVVLSQSNKKDKTNHLKYLCLCDCGNTVIVLGSSLRNGHTKSCGCLKIKHGKRYEKLYIIYSHMKDICCNRNNRRSNVYLTYKNRAQTIAQWSEELGIHYKCLWKRHKLGWTDKECLFGRDENVGV